VELITNMPTGLAAIIWGVVTFSILVVIHEGGHFLAARFFGVKVHEFMIGLPGPSLRVRSKRTGVAYGVTAIPLGGYVRIAGMEPGAEDDSLGRALGALVDARHLDAAALADIVDVSRDRAAGMLVTLEDYGAAETDRDSMEYRAVVDRGPAEDDAALLDRVRSGVYRGKPAWQRIVILAMGVVFNLLAAMAIFTITLSVWGYDVQTTKLGSIVKGSAAEAVGLRIGDRITSIDGVAVADWQSLLDHMRTLKPGRMVTLKVTRDGTPRLVPVTLRNNAGRAFLGIGPSLERKHFTVPEAARESLVWIGLVFVAVGRFFDPATAAQAVGDARSVVGISYEIAAAVKAGPINYAWMVALLSLSLGVMNILPIPPLDGGKIAVELFQAIRRRPLKREISLAFSAVGALLLFSLIFYLMYADIVRYIVKG
jgi:regulator of sigma E protease